VSKIFSIALGIIAALGGFVDIGDLVFNVQAGARFGYDLLWAVVLGVIGIATFAEMCGRVAAVSGRAVFDVVRERLGFGVGVTTLIASQFVNLLTLIAEIGGVALVLQLLTDLPYRVLILIATLVLTAIIGLARFNVLERVFGYIGLCLIVFVVAALHAGPDWGAVASGFVPSLRTNSDFLVYCYFTVGLVAAAMMPYEVYFYSSGAIEERWGPKDLGVNRANALLGYALGGFLSLALIMTAAQVFEPSGVDPEFLGTVALGAQVPLGEIGFLLACIGMLFAIGGAVVDSVFAGAYNLAQFAGWEWGKYKGAANAPRFTITWIALMAIAGAIVMTGLDPVQVTEYSVIFSVVALPFTYLPILLVARDRDYMGEHTNGPIANALGWIYFGVICVVSVVAVPLLFLTNMGQG
jgi:Mn2+/Fe2+ NRAMP family transporter